MWTCVQADGKCCIQLDGHVDNCPWYGLPHRISSTTLRVAPDTCRACRPRCRTVVHSASPPWLGAVGEWGCWCWGLRSPEQTSDASFRFFNRRFLVSRFTAACVRWTPSRWRYPSLTLPSPSVKEALAGAHMTLAGICRRKV